MKRAYIAETLVDAHLVADLLQGNGVPCEIFHQNASGAIGELPVTPPEVWVRRDYDLERAEHLVCTVELCTNTAEVACQHCLETNPVDFDICWQCQLPLSAAEKVKG